MAIEKINLNSTQDGITLNVNVSSEKKQQNNPLVIRAQELGINVEAYYVYNDKNECIGVDNVKLNAAIQEAMQAQTTAIDNNKFEYDSFEFTKTDDVYTSELNDKEAKSSQKTIDNEYTNAALKYAQSLDPDALSTSEEGRLVNQWEAIEADANKLTSFTAPNTTVLEGVKEFITNLSGLINSTKHYNASKDIQKESSVSIDTTRDIEDKNNNIEVYETNIFTSNPFKSAVETFDYEDEELAV